MFDNLDIDIKQDLPVGKEIIFLIDTIYFGNFGLMVFKDATSKKILYYKVVEYETNQAYKEGVQYLINRGVIIKTIVSDGRIGLLDGFGGIPTQFFIMIKITGAIR